MLIELIGRIYRKIPPIRGKGALAGMVLAPFIRGKGREVVVEMTNPGGGRLVCHLDDWIPWNVFIFGRYQVERKYESFLLKTAAGSKVIFDIGANIGYYTVQFGRLLNGKGVVHAFEPCSYQFAILQRNVKLNDLRNIVVNKKIVSDLQNGIKKIFFAGMENTGSSSLEVMTGEFEEVGCTTVDSYCLHNNIEMIDIVKIDVEGHEMSVLKGMKQVLNHGKVNKLFLEINSHALSSAGTSAEEVVTYLECFSYKPFSIAGGQATEYSMGHDESLVLFQRDTQ